MKHETAGQCTVVRRAYKTEHRLKQGQLGMSNSTAATALNGSSTVAHGVIQLARRMRSKNRVGNQGPDEMFQHSEA
jgi:hypothetical protein